MSEIRLLDEFQYDTDKVIVLKVSEEDVDGMLLNYSISDNGTYEYLLDAFIGKVMNYLPEYSLGYNTTRVSINEMVQKLKEAAKTAIKIKNVETIKKYFDENTPEDQWDKAILRAYKDKGLFSELILHFILKEFKGTRPLNSKIFFKDSPSVEAHGFDAVHVKDDILWLGETKFYSNGKSGLDELISDLNKHFKTDYLEEQFIVIKRMILDTDPERENWIKKLNSAKNLSDIFNTVIVPLLCIYENGIATDIIETIEIDIDGADIIYVEHINQMKEYFDNKNNYPNKDKLKTILILLPVESKAKIVTKMLEKIYHMQNI